MSNVRIEIPTYVKAVLDRMEKHGFEAFLVGGCVRDSLLGKVPGDYDVTTNALPEETEAVFRDDFRVIETGMKHGTVTVLSDGNPIEITTYRIDGEYTDCRRPDSVSFARNLREDLARRDFTVNAMAYSESAGIIDCFGGMEDLKNRIIRCVGEPQKRFSEDALRILRAIRFSSQLDFEIESRTEEAVFSCRDLLKNISAERISVELDKLIMGDNCEEVMMKYPRILGVFIPEILPCIGFEQHNSYHRYTVWEHIVKAVSSAKKDRTVRLAMLLHDIGKPGCFRLDEKGTGHFHDHEKLSAEAAGGILRRLRYDNHTIDRVTALIFHHYFNPSDNDRTVKKLLSKIGREAYFQLLDVQRADAASKESFCLERLPVLDSLEERGRKILAAEECFSLKNLAVNGNDLLALGFKGKAIGDTLNLLLGQVLDEKLPNEKNILLEYVKKLTSQN